MKDSARSMTPRKNGEAATNTSDSSDSQYHSSHLAEKTENHLNSDKHFQALLSHYHKLYPESTPSPAPVKENTQPASPPKNNNSPKNCPKEKAPKHKHELLTSSYTDLMNGATPKQKKKEKYYDGL